MRKQWFLDRVGKTVYRNDNGCTCFACQRVLQNGILIDDKGQANYLCDIENVFNAEGIRLRYFDTQEEVAEFEKRKG